MATCQNHHAYDSSALMLGRSDGERVSWSAVCAGWVICSISRGSVGEEKRVPYHVLVSDLSSGNLRRLKVSPQAALRIASQAWQHKRAEE